MKKKILYFVADENYFISHRLHIAFRAKQDGFDICLLTAAGSKKDFFKMRGIDVHYLNLNRSSLNILKEFLLLLKIIKFYRKHQPDIVHQVAMKPVIYGTFAAFVTGIPKIINAIAGMGYVFTDKKSPITKLVRYFLKCCFKFILGCKSSVTVVQNEDDANYFYNLNPNSKIEIISGAGVDEKKFTPDYNFFLRPPCVYIVTMVSRLLWTKGVGEFLQAAKILKEISTGQHPTILMRLVGDVDLQNPATVDKKIILQYHRENLIEYMGHREDIEKIYQTSHIAILPSYREGTPKSLLEAASCGLPIITCDVTGCGHIIDGNGILIPPKNPMAIVDAVLSMVKNHKQMIEFGKKSRDLVLQKYTQEKIQQKTLGLYY